MLTLSGKEVDPKTKPSKAGRVAWAVTLISLTLAALGIGMAVYLRFSTVNSLVPPHMLFSPISALIFSITGALIASRHPKNPIGWLFVVVGLLSALILLASAYYGVSQIVPLPGENFFLWLQTWVWIPTSLIPLSFLLQLFPDGRLPSSRWKPILIAAAIGLVGVLFAIGFHPDPDLQEGIGLPAPNPYALAGAGRALTNVLYISGGLMAVAVIGSVAAIVVRYRQSSGIRRTQMKWLAYAGSFVIAGLVVSACLASIYPGDPAIEEITIVITDLVVTGIAAAAGVAMVRHGLYDINLLINRTLVYGALTVAVIGIYILMVGLLGTLFRSGGNLVFSLIATGVVAVGFQPLKERLQRGVNHLLYGERDEPYAVISRLGRRLGSTLEPEAVLSTITETIAQTLKLPYVAICLRSKDGFRTAASTGESQGDVHSLPLRYQSEEFGSLLCSPRSPGEPFTPTEQKLLKDVAQQASVAVHAARLTTDLLRAHRRLVRAREEERRRIRRDLHDGLGTMLASHRLKIGSSAQMLEGEPEAARALLQEIEEELTTALDDIRRLVYDLRPPALDELGLVRALQQSAPQVPNFAVTFDIPQEIPELPAAVDVAAYRIIQEALNNCVRHAKARQVTVGIKAGEYLDLSIQDNGVGLPENYLPGVGLNSMRARAEELGGTFELQWTTGEGTTIFVRLPLEEREL
ncbi:MAG: GAF domain-containing sensor histidine kinase [Anaerolineales bacterium]|jgi:two-component system NarL family sensor kinase